MFWLLTLNLKIPNGYIESGVIHFTKVGIKHRSDKKNIDFSGKNQIQRLQECSM